MSRQFRHRTAGVALVALFVAAPLLESLPAYADGAQDGQQVIFGGRDVFGLSCEARPDVQALTVPAESTVQVVNDTGRGADLLLDGRSQGAIPENGSTPVVFRRGTVSLALQPDCPFERESAPVLVTIAPSAPPSPTGGPPSSSPSPSVSPSGAVDPGPSQTRPTTPTVTVSVSLPHGSPTPPRSTPATSTPRATRTPGAGRPDARPRSTTDVVRTGSGRRRTDGSGNRSWAVTDPPATPSSVATPTTPPPSTDAVPAPGLPPVERPSSAPAVPSTAEPAAEAVAELRPLTRTGGTGLLALMATVCVMGVMAGAVRTIAAQRASRANMA